MADNATLLSKTVVGAIWLLVWRLFTRVLGLASTLILARLLVPADFGLVAMATTFLAVIESLSTLGVNEALVRQQGDSHALYDTAFTLQLIRAVLTAMVLVALAPVAATWFHEARVGPIMLVLAGGTVINGLENIGIVELRRQLRYDMQFRLLLVPRLAQVFTTIPIAFAMHTYWALMIGIIAQKIVRVIMTYLVHPHRPRLQLKGAKELAGFTFWTWATSVALLLWSRSEPFVLGPRIGPEQLGVFMLAVELATLPLTELVAPVADALFAGFSAAQRAGESSLRHAPVVASTMILGMAPIIVGISCASGDLVVLLLGPKWVAAEQLIAILAWVCFFSPFSAVCSLVMVANARVRTNFFSNVTVAVVKLVVLLITLQFTQRLDLISYATAICVGVESTVYTLQLKRVGRIRLMDSAGGLLRTLIATAITVMVLAGLGLGWTVVTVSPLQAVGDAAVIGIVALLVYSAAVYGLWRLAGFPEGQETRLLSVLEGRLRSLAPVFLRFRRAG